MFLSACRIQHRAYNVRAPLALWHIDGNHKLISYNFQLVCFGPKNQAIAMDFFIALSKFFGMISLRKIRL